MSPSNQGFLISFAIAVLAYILLIKLVEKVKNPEHKDVFGWILLLACILFALLGSFLPWAK